MKTGRPDSWKGLALGLAVVLAVGCILRDGRYPDGYLILTEVNMRLPVVDNETSPSMGSAIVLRENARAVVATPFGTEIEYLMGDYYGKGLCVRFHVMNSGDVAVDVVLAEARSTVGKSSRTLFPMFIGHDAFRCVFVVYDMRGLSDEERKNYSDPGYGDRREDGLPTVYERNVKEDIVLEPGQAASIILDFGNVPQPLVRPEINLPLRRGDETIEYSFVFEAWDADKAGASGLDRKGKGFRFDR